MKSHFCGIPVLYQLQIWWTWPTLKEKSGAEITPQWSHFHIHRMSPFKGSDHNFTPKSFTFCLFWNYVGCKSCSILTGLYPPPPILTSSSWKNIVKLWSDPLGTVLVSQSDEAHAMDIFGQRHRFFFLKHNTSSSHCSGMLFLKKIVVLGMLFLGFAVFQDFKSYCIGMKSRNKMKTKNCSGIETPSTPLPYCAHGMWQNFCFRNDSCNSKIWNLGIHENKGITFLKQKKIF